MISRKGDQDSESVVFERIIPSDVKKIWVKAEVGDNRFEQSKLKSPKSNDRISGTQYEYGDALLSRDVVKEDDDRKPQLTECVSEQSEIANATGMWGVNLKHVGQSDKLPFEFPKLASVRCARSSKRPSFEKSSKSKSEKRTGSLDNLDKVDDNNTYYPSSLSVSQRRKNFFEKLDSKNKDISKQTGDTHGRSRLLNSDVNNVDLRSEILTNQIFYQPRIGTSHDDSAKSSKRRSLVDLLNEDRENSQSFQSDHSSSGENLKTDSTKNDINNTSHINHTINNNNIQKPFEPVDQSTPRITHDTVKVNNTSVNINQKTSKIIDNSATQTSHTPFVKVNHISNKTNTKSAKYADDSITRNDQSTVLKEKNVDNVTQKSPLSLGDVMPQKQSIQESPTAEPKTVLVASKSNDDNKPESKSSLETNIRPKSSFVTEKKPDKLQENDGKGEQNSIKLDNRNENMKSKQSEQLKKADMSNHSPKPERPTLNIFKQTYESELHKELKSGLKSTDVNLNGSANLMGNEKQNVIASTKNPSTSITDSRQKETDSNRNKETNATPLQNGSGESKKDSQFVRSNGTTRRVGKLIIMTGEQRDQQLKNRAPNKSDRTLIFISNEVAVDDEEESYIAPKIVYNGPVTTLPSIMMTGKKKKKKGKVHFKIDALAVVHSYPSESSLLDEQDGQYTHVVNAVQNERERISNLQPLEPNKNEQNSTKINLVSQTDDFNSYIDKEGSSTALMF